MYLHCDPTASHYLKIICDSIFGPKLFVNEIIWKQYGAHNDARQGSKHYGRINDTILFFSKSENRTWNQLWLSVKTRPISKKLIGYSTRQRETDLLRRRSPGREAQKKEILLFEFNGHTRAWRYSEETMQGLHDQGRLYYSKTGIPKT